MFGKEVYALLDSGASITCVGNQAAQEFLDSEKEFKHLNEFVKTTGGRELRIVVLVQSED